MMGISGQTCTMLTLRGIQKVLCGCICCGSVWLCHFWRFSDYEQRWPSTDCFVGWKYSCCPFSLSDCEVMRFWLISFSKMNKQHQEKVFRGMNNTIALGIVYYTRNYRLAGQTLPGSAYFSLSEFRVAISKASARKKHLGQCLRLLFGTLTLSHVTWRSNHVMQEMQPSRCTGKAPYFMGDSVSHFTISTVTNTSKQGFPKSKRYFSIT
jgi:hypothetical protein